MGRGVAGASGHLGLDTAWWSLYHAKYFSARGRWELAEGVLMKVALTTIKRTIAAAELLLIFPAVLFMTALFVRNWQPEQYEPAHTAQRIVTWYAARPRLGLWVLLIASPLAVLVAGSATLLRTWNDDAALRQATRHTGAAIRAPLATVLVAGATLTAACVLAIVAVHSLTD